MKAPKTELQVFIGTAAGFWRAIGELVDVERRFGGDRLQREAHDAQKSLQKTLDEALDEWNCMGDTYPHVSLCVAKQRHVDWIDDGCAIYTTGSICESCAVDKAACDAATEADAQLERDFLAVQAAEAELDR